MIKISRLGLLAILAASLAIGAFAQFLLSDSDTPWYASVALYAVAIALFVGVAALARRQATPAVVQSGIDFRGTLIEMLHDPLWPWCLISVALVASYLAAREANLVSGAASAGEVMGLWLVSCAAFATAFLPWGRAAKWRRPRLEALREALRPVLPEAACVAAIVLLAFVLRAYDLEHIPANFGGDEGEMGLQALAFLSGTLRNPFSTSWLDHQTMWFFLQSISIQLFGPSAGGLRMLSAVFGTLSILTTFLLVREVAGRTLALVTAALLCVAAFHLHFSRLAISSIGDPFWTSLVLFLFMRGLNQRRIGYFVAAGLALGYSQCFYHGMRLLLVTLAVLLGYLFIQDRRALLAEARNLATMGVAAVIACAPQILLYVRFPDLFVGHWNTMGIIPSGWLARTAASTGQSALAIILGRAQHWFLTFNAYPEVSGFYAPQRPLLDNVSGILFLFGVGLAISRIRNRTYFMFLAWFALAMFFGAVMVIDENGVERFVTASVPVAFLVAAALVELATL